MPPCVLRSSLSYHLSYREVEALSDLVRDVCTEVVADDDVPGRPQSLLQIRLDQLGTLLPVEEVRPEGGTRARRGETRRVVAKGKAVSTVVQGCDVGGTRSRSSQTAPASPRRLTSTC